MRKVVLITCLLLMAGIDWVQAQYIRTEQYTVLVERRIWKNDPQYGQCNRYASWTEFDDPSTPYIETPVLGGWNMGYAGRKFLDWQWDAYQDWWWTPDATCTTCSHEAKLALQYKPVGGNAYTVGQVITLPFNSVVDEEHVYYDTLHLFQPFNLEYFNSAIYENTIMDVENWWDNPNFNINCDWRYYHDAWQGPNLLYFSGGLASAETYYQSYDRNYSLKTKIQVIPSPDVTYSLPSHDKIIINHVKATGVSQLSQTNFQYQDPLTNAWLNVPRSLYKNDEALELSGYDLFGAGYVNRLNATINFKISNAFSGAVQADIAAFTLRLSSPHITSVSPTNLICYERNEGSLKIQFDRALLPQEKLNILLYDTVSKTNYSTLNLTALAPDNTFIWPNELRAGTYYVSLLGKYAKGIEYDLTVNARVDSVPKYVAMNTVNFEDGFTTPQTDDFDSYTDYTGYSQATYTGSFKHWAIQKLEQPQKIWFTASVQNNVLCKGSSTGAITITAAGGTKHLMPQWPFSSSNFKYSFKREGETDYSPWVYFTNHEMTYGYIDNNTYTLRTIQQVNNLKAGKYMLRVRDEVDCYAKDINGNEITDSFTITEPEKGIMLDLFEVSPITSPDAGDAQVKVQVSGGTPFINGEIFHYPYNVTFTDSATGQQLPLTNTILEANKRMQSVTGNLGEGIYHLRIYDVYHASSVTDPGGCFLEMRIPIAKPDPLIVAIKGRKPVSCYDSTNGQLIANASGGIQIDSLKYVFKWYKVTNGVSTLLTNTDSVMENVAAGIYQVKVTDKYNNSVSSQAFDLIQPSPLLLTLTSTPTNCYSDSNGVLEVAVTGGTPYNNGSYTYEWSTGARTPVVNNVMGGDYVIVVTDSMFCMARGTVAVTSPVRIMANPVVTQVTCRGRCDGQIALNATGGQGVYTYKWNTGATTATISNLCAGSYWYTVTDAGGCAESDTITLDNPDTLAVSLGADRKICIGQTIRLNATASDTALLSYNWQSDNGFTANTAKVSLTQAGTYRVAVGNRGGCVVRDTIVLNAQNSLVNTEFIVSTQAFVNENVTLINLSQPRSDSVKWLFPVNGNVVRPILETNDKCELIFADTGRYAITMQAYYASGCIDDTTKNVSVLSRGGTVTGGSQSEAYLKAAVIYPNPNNGTFWADLNFSEVTRARLRLISSLTNAIVDDKLIQGQKDYHLDYNTGMLPSGVYMLVIDAAKGSFVYKVIIVH